MTDDLKARVKRDAPRVYEALDYWRKLSGGLGVWDELAALVEAVRKDAYHKGRHDENREWDRRVEDPDLAATIRRGRG